MMDSSRHLVAVRFPSGGVTCAAWHYEGDSGACVVMAPGFAVTKEPGTDAFAAAFHAAGYSVLAFDFRGFGESEGDRHVARIGDQVEDFTSAVAFARGLPEVDEERIAARGFSLSGGHVFRLAAQLRGLGAAVAVSPTLDGPAASRNASRYTTTAALARVTARALRDAVRGTVGRPPLLLPLTGPPGSAAMLSTPDALDGGRALDPDGVHTSWTRTASARSVLALSTYSPGRHAHRVRCPLLVLVSEGDRTALAAPAIEAAGRAPAAEVVRLPGGHYAPFLDAHDRAVEVQLAFLDRHFVLERRSCLWSRNRASRDRFRDGRPGPAGLRRSRLVVALNRPFSGWTKTFTDPMLCAAIVERLTFNGQIIEPAPATTGYRNEEPPIRRACS